MNHNTMNTLLHERALPPLLSREEMLDILQREEYGYLPPKPDSLVFEVTENIIRNFCAGKAVCSKITAHITLNGKSYSFPFHEARPTCGTKHPFLFISTSGTTSLTAICRQKSSLITDSPFYPFAIMTSQKITGILQMDWPVFYTQTANGVHPTPVNSLCGHGQHNG